MSRRVRQRSRAALAAAPDGALLAAVATLSVEAVAEAYERHAGDLLSLALLIAEDVELAQDAVAAAFIALWRSPETFGLEQQTLHVALAGEVYSGCAGVGERSERGSTRMASASHGSRSGTMASLSRLPDAQRDLLALILYGKHDRHQAARRVGLSDDDAARMVIGALRAIRESEGESRSVHLDGTLRSV